MTIEVLNETRINWWSTKLSPCESNAAANAVSNAHLSCGPVTNKFEDQIAKMLHVKHSVACPSGTMALVMSLLVHGIGPGDEVIVPATTWISTANAIKLVGADAIFVDVLSHKPVMDVSLVEEKITSRTKAIIPVHLNGISVDLGTLKSIIKSRDIVIIEDACQALLSSNQQGFLGTQSSAGCYSLGVTKLITTGQGGFVVTNNTDVYKQLLLVRNNGMKDINNPRYLRFGANFKFSDILSSIGIAQLQKAETHKKKVSNIYREYETAINKMKHIDIIPVDHLRGEVPLYVQVMCNQRQLLMSYLSSKNIDTRVLPPCLTEAPQFQLDQAFECSLTFANDGLYLPSGPGQDQGHVKNIIEHLSSFDEGVYEKGEF